MSRSGVFSGCAGIDSGHALRATRTHFDLARRPRLGTLFACLTRTPINPSPEPEDQSMSQSEFTRRSLLKRGGAAAAALGAMYIVGGGRGWTARAADEKAGAGKGPPPS